MVTIILIFFDRFWTDAIDQQRSGGMDSSALLDALLQDTEDEGERESELPTSAAACAIAERGCGGGSAALGAVDRVPFASSSSEGSEHSITRRIGKSPSTHKQSTRQRERAELVRLRAEEEALQLQITRLHHRNNSNDDSRTAHTSVLWLRVAKSQLERRQQAQVENLKLRYMVDRQFKVMKEMDKLLRKRSTSSVRIVRFLLLGTLLVR